MKKSQGFNGQGANRSVLRSRTSNANTSEKTNRSGVLTQESGRRCTWSFSDALAALELKHTTAPLLATHPELLAIISHWLQSPGDPPIYGDSAIAAAWSATLRNGEQLALFRSGQLGGAYDSFQILFPKGVNRDQIPFPPPLNPTFRFVDLFAGIGGFRLAMQAHGGKCVFSCELDPEAKKTYYRNFGEVPFGDIRQFTGPGISDSELDALVPDHDVLTAGFPCQPFSRAGVSARRSLDQDDGFACEAQGTLFFDIARIAKVKEPKVLFLENVRNLRSHDGGKTMEVIRTTLEDIGYVFSTPETPIDAQALVPQRRQRCYMVCVKKPAKKFVFPIERFAGPSRPLKSVLERNVDDVYTISIKLWQGHINRSLRNKERGTGFTTAVADLDKPANTLVARYGKDGKECLIPQVGKPPRMLTPRECARLQGFPEEFILPKYRSPAYRQFGNSVAVPVVSIIAGEIAKLLQVIPENAEAR